MNRYMARVFISLMPFLLGSFWALAQIDPALDDDNFYTREWVGGINLNTNGGLIGGVMFKHSRHIRNKMYHVFQVEVVNVKHPKEQQLISRYNGSTFVGFKHNYLWVIRPQYGREVILFKKAREKGIQVSFVGAGGLALGLVAPYLVEYDDPNGTQKIVQFDLAKNHDPINVVGTANFFQALGEADLEVGLNLKASVNFEFGIIKSSVSGFEAGFNVDLFRNRIEILDPQTEAENRKVYTSIFLTLFFGSRK